MTPTDFARLGRVPAGSGTHRYRRVTAHGRRRRQRLGAGITARNELTTYEDRMRRRERATNSCTTLALCRCRASSCLHGALTSCDRHSRQLSIASWSLSDVEDATAANRVTYTPRSWPHRMAPHMKFHLLVCVVYIRVLSASLPSQQPLYDEISMSTPDQSSAVSAGRREDWMHH